MTYRRPDEKKFCIISESGSELLQGRVLKRLLAAEAEAMQEEQRRQTAMGPENYEFRLVTYDRTVLLYPRSYAANQQQIPVRGRIWVEGQDFAVARMEGEPSKNPSWWTKHNAIQVTYAKDRPVLATCAKRNQYASAPCREFFADHRLSGL